MRYLNAKLILISVALMLSATASFAYCSANTLLACNKTDLCNRATETRNSKAVWVQNGSVNAPFAYEARKRQIVCNGALKYDEK